MQLKAAHLEALEYLSKTSVSPILLIPRPRIFYVVGSYLSYGYNTLALQFSFPSTHPCVVYDTESETTDQEKREHLSMLEQHGTPCAKARLQPPSGS